jgi:hypothetical protein
MTSDMTCANSARKSVKNFDAHRLQYAAKAITSGSMNKIKLDTKKWITADGITTRAYGYYSVTDGIEKIIEDQRDLRVTFQVDGVVRLRPY